MAIPRSNIKKITVQNFKFFQQPLEFELNDNHLLLYGENGSGKSSLYWALYTLLECANKENAIQIQKYFNPTNDERLTNIFLTPGNPDWVDSEIKIELEDNSVFSVNFANTSINANSDAQAANYASDFLNYKMIFQLQNFAHSEDINIFNYLSMYVLPYVKFAPVKYWLKDENEQPIAEKETENADKIWNFVLAGPPKTGKTKIRTDRYPIQREPDYAIYENIVNGFKIELENLLTFINTQGNPILTAFGYDFTFKLVLEEIKPFKISTNNFQPPQFAVRMQLPNFSGKTGISKPHTFLNEARLSALGLAIRFALLNKRLQDSKLKVAVLDDFMISLDMQNREVALDYIFTHIAPKYQILFLTHDMHLYEFTAYQLDKKRITNWVKYKMFEDNNGAGNLFPKIIEDKGLLNKAAALFRERDYPTSASVLRKATEKFCKNYLTSQEQLGGNYMPLQLDGMLIKVLQKAGLNALPHVLITDLQSYKDNIMNPSVHYDVETPQFNVELNKAIMNLEQLSQLTGISI